MPDAIYYNTFLVVMCETCCVQQGRGGAAGCGSDFCTDTVFKVANGLTSGK